MSGSVSEDAEIGEGLGIKPEEEVEDWVSPFVQTNIMVLVVLHPTDKCSILQYNQWHRYASNVSQKT